MKKLILAGILAFSVVYANEASTELEHAIKSPSNIEDTGRDMSKMKAAGKCGANQKTTHTKRTPTKQNKASLELEHAMKTQNGVDSPREDMSKMRAAGKCGK